MSDQDTRYRVLGQYPLPIDDSALDTKTVNDTPSGSVRRIGVVIQLNRKNRDLTTVLHSVKAADDRILEELSNFAKKKAW